MSIAKKVREYKVSNPNAKIEEIAKACETSTGYVYQVMYKMKHKKVKAAKKAKPIATQPTEGQKVVRSEITRLHKDIDDWRSLYLSSFDEIEQLKQDVIGYRAVISYLQGQLDGLAV